MKRVKEGLYTSTTGGTVTWAHRSLAEGVYFAWFFPYDRQTYFYSHRNFASAFPIPVKGIEVEKGAEKAEVVREGELYSDGTRLVVAAHVQANQVKYLEVLESATKLFSIAKSGFLRRYPWELYEVEFVY